MTRRFLLASLLLCAAAVHGELTLPEIPTNSAAPRLLVPEPERVVPKTNAAAQLPPVNAAETTHPSPNVVVREPLSLLPPPVQPADVLSFTNGDQFVGTFIGIEAGTLQWRLPAAQQLVRFRNIGLESLELVATITTNPPSPTGWLVFLTDGSLLRARSVTLTADRLQADLGLAGPVTLPRQQLAALRRVEKGINELISFDDAPVYGVPTKGVVAGSAFRARYRDVALPEHVLLEFEWPTDELLSANLRLFAGAPAELNRASSQINLNFSRLSASLWMTDTQNNPRITWAKPVTNSTARSGWVAFAFSRKSGEAALYWDGNLVGRGTLSVPEKSADFGLAVAIGQRSYAMPRQVLVTRLGEALALPASASDKDALTLANFDSMSGRLEAVTSNSVVFTSSFERTELPLERMTQVAFARGATDARQPGDAILSLTGGELLRASLQRVDEKIIVAHNTAVGTVTLPRRALASADFALDTPTNNSSEMVYDQELPFARGGGDVRNWLLMRRQSFGSYEPGLLRLKSRSQYHGDLIGISDGVVQWQHPAAVEPLAVAENEIQRLAPSWRSLPAFSAAGSSAVRLRNGNIVTGTLNETDPAYLELATIYAGNLKIPRHHVAAVSAMPALESIIAKGPTAEWTRPSGGPVNLHNGLVWMDGPDRSCSRRLNLPDRVRLDFEATWSPGPLVLNARLFHSTSTNEERRIESFYGVDFRDGAVNFTASLPALTNAQMRSMVPATQLMTNLSQRCQGVFTVFADRSTNLLRVCLDGRLAAEWRAPAGLKPTGDGIQISANANAALALRQVVVSQWRDLTVAHATPLPPIPAARGPTEMLVVLHNGDRLTLSSLRGDVNALTGHNQLLGPVTLSRAFIRLIEWPLPPPQKNK